MAIRVIERVNNRGVKIRGQWIDFVPDYTGIPYEEIEPGREYEVKFVKDEGQGRWYVANIAPVEEAEQETSRKQEYEERETRIARMNALGHATQIAISIGLDDPEEVIKIAERFYSYIIEGR